MPHTELGQKRNETPVSLAVIGSGIIGLCTALEAQRKGCRVTLFDRDEPGLGASFGNAGFLATELIEPLSNPQTLRSALMLWLNPNGPLSLPLQYLIKIAPWLVKFIKAARPKSLASSRHGLIQLNKNSIDAWQRCLDDIDASEQIVNSGYLLVWESSSKLADALKHQDWLSENGIATELVQGRRLVELEPALKETVSHALFFPEACRVREPYELCRLLFNVFMARGGAFVQQEVKQITPSADQVSLKTAADELDAEIEQLYTFKKTIVCAGAWSKKLLEGVGVHVPLEAERGYHLTLPEAGSMLQHSIGSAERKFVMGPLDSGLRVVGITQLGGLKLGPFKHCFNILRHNSSKLLPELEDPSLSVTEWMGHRPTLPDSLPVIDQHPLHPQLLFAFGNQHLGLTQAALTAELIIQLMQEDTSKIDLSPYRVDRF
ncbi:NAD(P)/FAD-dependent oxidoreductase [Amphritea japonica]|uniref:D-amino-acid dehydrogenase n=1 Tax=Amphritea japonica ATCC BAA-1530 TaxID=1278309 RepID=A0A7R6SS41_9GAMM|nr:FAD-binding oxidoreductase [Amphritea japonica]BBB25825.1 D-amino-acid dehydrogenase [Amphritea japonica ATCC BAA-1530]